MRIISLACKSCGAPLEINEKMEQLACAHCGARMYVERGGGAISLQLEALGSIRTGAVQTAAELALVRLEKEFREATSRITSFTSVEREAQEAESLFRKQDLISEKAAAAANDQAIALRADIERSSFKFVGPFLIIGIIIVCLFGACTQNGFFSGLLVLIAWGILGFLAFFVIMIPAAILDDFRENRLTKRLKEVEGIIARHQSAIAQQSRLSSSREILEQLPAARTSLARIEEEIARNRSIVSQR
ncbi:MAG: hypothetical protein M3O61_14650 [Gemmatimonadota bacterium]|nr:hypothetical protein [Gemmatimonadota bacterium]